MQHLKPLLALLALLLLSGCGVEQSCKYVTKVTTNLNYQYRVCVRGKDVKGTWIWACNTVTVPATSYLYLNVCYHPFVQTVIGQKLETGILGSSSNTRAHPGARKHPVWARNVLWTI